MRSKNDYLNLMGPRGGMEAELGCQFEVQENVQHFTDFMTPYFVEKLHLEDFEETDFQKSGLENKKDCFVCDDSDPDLVNKSHRVHLVTQSIYLNGGNTVIRVSTKGNSMELNTKYKLHDILYKTLPKREISVLTTFYCESCGTVSVQIKTQYKGATYEKEIIMGKLNAPTPDNSSEKLFGVSSNCLIEPEYVELVAFLESIEKYDDSVPDEESVYKVKRDMVLSENAPIELSSVINKDADLFKSALKDTMDSIEVNYEESLKEALSHKYSSYFYNVHYSTLERWHNKYCYIEWLLELYLEVDNSIGDLARDVKSDSNFPIDDCNLNEYEDIVINYLNSKGSCEGAIEAFKESLQYYFDYLAIWDD